MNLVDPWEELAWGQSQYAEKKKKTEKWKKKNPKHQIDIDNVI